MKYLINLFCVFILFSYSGGACSQIVDRDTTEKQGAGKEVISIQITGGNRMHTEPSLSLAEELKGVKYIVQGRVIGLGLRGGRSVVVVGQKYMPLKYDPGKGCQYYVERKPEAEFDRHDRSKWGHPGFGFKNHDFQYVSYEVYLDEAKIVYAAKNRDKKADRIGKMAIAIYPVQGVVDCEKFDFLTKKIVGKRHIVLLAGFVAGDEDASNGWTRARGYPLDTVQEDSLPEHWDSELFDGIRLFTLPVIQPVRVLPELLELIESNENRS